jgi:hypothetical protein
MTMRLRCHLFGCCPDPLNACVRCDTYDGDTDNGWIEADAAWLAPLLRRWWRLSIWWRYHCHFCCTQCGRLFWPWQRVSDEFCSQNCFDQWQPF